MLYIRLLNAVVPQITCLRLAHLAAICNAAPGQVLLRLASTSADSNSDVIVVPMPKLSPTMTEGTVSKWLKVGPSKQPLLISTLSGCDAKDPQGCLHILPSCTHVCGQAPGDEVREFDIVMEVDTEGLTEDAYKVGDFAGNVTLLVEAQAGCQTLL